MDPKVAELLELWERAYRLRVNLWTGLLARHHPEVLEELEECIKLMRRCFEWQAQQMKTELLSQMHRKSG